MQIAVKPVVYRPVTLRQLSVRLALLTAAITVVFLMIGGSAEADIPGPPPIEYTVEAGDSLWSIAAQHSPDGSDVRRLVADIEETSGVEGDHIVPGQLLLIPTG